MITFNSYYMKPSCLIAGLLAVTPLANAERVELLNSDTLTGTITSMTGDTTTLKSPISLSPLEINSSNIKRITFPDTPQRKSPHTEIITLVNGDLLPCSVTAMDKDKINFSTSYAGDFTVTTENIHSLSFGVSKEKILYSGGDPISDWHSSKGTWTLRDGVYNAKKIGYIARKLDLPKNIRIRFDLAWRDTPNFAFRFCADHNSATTKQDSYELTFNSAGMRISRYEGTHDVVTLTTIGLKPNTVKNNKVSIDLRIDRSKGSITLYLNDHKVDTYFDSFKPTRGNFIIFNTRSNNSSACTLSNISVSELGKGASSRAISKKNPIKSDFFLDNEGNRITGNLVSITVNQDKSRTLQFKPEHASKPLMIPGHRISALYFAEGKHDTEFPKSNFTLHLAHYGSLQLDQPQLANNKVIIRHPILGHCAIDTNVISSITQRENPAKK